MLLNALFFVILYEKICEVNILGICQNGDVLSAFRIVNMVILIIKIVVPILLILTGMITLMNTIKVGNEDLLAKSKKQLVSNCIAAIVIFLIPTLVNVIVKTNGAENGYKACLTSATEEGITYAYITTADTLVAKAEETKTYNDYYAVVNCNGKTFTLFSSLFYPKYEETKNNRVYNYLYLGSQIEKILKNMLIVLVMIVLV